MSIVVEMLLEVSRARRLEGVKAIGRVYPVPLCDVCPIGPQNVISAIAVPAMRNDRGGSRGYM